jgi:hypothetical protein
MSQDEDHRRSRKLRGSLDKFEPGGDPGSIEDRSQYEQRLNALPAEQKQLAQENARLADLCQYFSRTRIEIPPPLMEQIGRLVRLPLSERTGAVKNLNRELMEYLNDVGQDSGIRQ